MQKKKTPISYAYDEYNFNPPALVLEISLSAPFPSEGQTIKFTALLDSGADISVIPRQIARRLRLRYVNKITVAGFDGAPKTAFVYSVRIISDHLEDFIIQAITANSDHVLIGRDILNKWLLFLKGPSKKFEIS